MASGHRVIARESGVDDTWTLASALSARSQRTLRSKIKATYLRNPRFIAPRVASGLKGGNGATIGSGITHSPTGELLFACGNINRTFSHKPLFSEKISPGT